MEPRLMLAAMDDSYTARYDEVLNIAAPGVLANDTNVGLLDFFDAQSVKGAPITWQPDGSFAYDPTSVATFQALAPGESLVDTFTYLIYLTGTEQESVATVHITVDGPEVVTVNRPPIAVFDTLVHDKREPATVAAPGVLANDSDPDASDAPTVTRYDAKSAFGADVVVNGDGSYTYTPTLTMNLLPGQTIADSFAYTVSDADGLTSTATVFVEYTETIAIPSLFYATDADKALNVDSVSGLAGDYRQHGYPLVALAGADSTSMLGAKLTSQPDGSFVYDPTSVAAFRDLKLGEYVEDTFNFTVTDSTRTGTATAAVLVYGRPDDGEDVFTATAEFATTFAAPGVLANDVGSGLMITAFDALSVRGATIAMLPDGSFMFDPTYSAMNQLLGPGDTNLDQFTYTTKDSSGATRTVLVSVVVSGFDHPITTISDEYQTDKLSILRVSAANGLTANDYDTDALGDGTLPTMRVLDRPYNRPGDANRDSVFDSSDLVQVLIAGKFGRSQPADAIWEEGDWNNDGAFDFNDLLLASGIPGYEDPHAPPPNPGQYDISGDGQVDDVDQLIANQGVRSLRGARVEVHADGSFVYDPSTSPEIVALGEGDSLIDEFLYSVTDASGRTQRAFVQIDVRGRERSPEARDDAFDVTAGVTLGVQLGMNLLRHDLTYAADPALTIVDYQQVSTLGAHVFLSQDGFVTYDSTPSPQIADLHPGQNLVDVFTYTVEDTNGRRSTANVRMTVFGVSEAPDDLFTAVVGSVREITGPGVLANDPLYLNNSAVTKVTVYDAASALGATIVVQPGGGFTYDPRGVAALSGLVARQIVYDSFTYTTNPNGTGPRHRVNVVVSAAPEGPTAPTLGGLPPGTAAVVSNVTKVAENPEYGARNIAEFYAGLPVNINSNPTAPTSRYDYEIIDFRGTPMLKINLLPALGGDNVLWRLVDGTLTELIYVRNGTDTAVQYTAVHTLPDVSTYQSVWIVGFDRARNRFIDVHGTKPVVVSGGNQNDYIELKNLTALTTLPNEEFYTRIDTGDGDDRVLASGARDRIDLGAGADTAYANGGDDLILGGPGKDTIDGNDGRNIADAGPAGEGDIITNATNTLPAPSLDVIQRKLKPEELAKTKEVETIFFDDGPPEGARFVDWRDHRTPVEVVKADGPVQSGDKSFTNNGPWRGFQFDNATTKLKIVGGDKLFAYVYLDSTTPPTKIALNYRVGGQWQNGAYWGQEPLLKPGQELRRGQSLWSPDGSLQLVMQTDGNLVLYNQAQGGVKWASNTTNSGADRAVMQSDGNFVVYAGGEAKWNSGSQNNPGATLHVQADGNLVIYGLDGGSKWASNTAGGVEILKTTRLGDLPEKGKWVKLEIDPAMIGLKPGDEINGMFFRAIDGKATWDKAGIVQVADKDAPELSVRLTSDVLTIVGSENYGFQVQGNWSVSAANGSEIFTAVGPMTLKAKIGDIPFVSPPISILTKADDVANFGIVSTPSISFAGMTLRTAALGALNDLLDNVGLNLSLSGMQFGVALGKTLTGNLLKQVGAPLVDSIPYLYFSSFNAPSISFGEIGIGVDNTAGMAVIFDPADPFLYVTGQDRRGDVAAIAVSKNGYIPFAPVRPLDVRMGDDMFGNVYVRGKVVIPVKAVDVGIDGEITVDTDLNDDGNNFYNEFDPQFFSQIFTGQLGPAATKFVNALQDLGVGVNGKLSVGFSKAGIGIELPVGTATALFKGDRFGFNGGTVNPFAGTFLEKFNTAGEVELNGYFDSSQFAVQAKFASAKFGAVQFAGDLRITHRDITANFQATSPVPAFPQLKITGKIKFNGEFYLIGEVGRSFGFGPFDAGMNLILALGRDSVRSFYMNGQFKAFAQVNIVVADPLRISFDVGGGIAVADAFLFNFRGDLRVFADLPWPVPNIETGIGFNIDNGGFEVGMPGPIPNIRVRF